MPIVDLRMQHFRSFTDESFEFGQSVNIIVGANASGKTNLLEALLVVCRGASYRAKDSELIQFEQPWARLDSRGDSERVVKLAREPATNKLYEIDGKPYRRLTMQHSVPVVLFEPTHLQLLSGSPELRRNYLDELLEQTEAGYASRLRQFKRTLSQRNALLKRGAHEAATQLFPWNIRLSELSAEVARSRARLIERLNGQIGSLYKDLSHTRTGISLVYRAGFDLETYETRMIHKLEADASVDIARGFTGTGAHREDFSVLFDDHLAESTASRGEARTLVLGLKILELELLRDFRGQAPLLLLDDVFSELDGSRRRALTSYLQPYQTFLTTTDADVVVQHFMEECTIIPMQKNQD